MKRENKISSAKSDFRRTKSRKRCVFNIVPAKIDDRAKLWLKNGPSTMHTNEKADEAPESTAGIILLCAAGAKPAKAYAFSHQAALESITRSAVAENADEKRIAPDKLLVSVLD